MTPETARKRAGQENSMANTEQESRKVAAETAADPAPVRSRKKGTDDKEQKSDKTWTVVGIVLCVILVPILIVNYTMIVKGLINKNQVPTFLGYCPMIVLTDSMSPYIDSGDLIVDKSVKIDDVKVGDVISFFDPDGNGTSVVTHRVVEILNENGKISFRTKGDFNNTEDKTPVPSSNLVGRYLFKIKGAGNVAMWLQTTPGLIVCVGVPVVLLVTYELIRRRKYEQAKQDDTDALLKELEELRAAKKAAEEKEE